MIPEILPIELKKFLLETGIADISPGGPNSSFTFSYKRLVPGFEAPIKSIFGLANRSAAIRIPKYANTSDTKRFEFRSAYFDLD